MAIDYLVVGNLTRDVHLEGGAQRFVIGGTAAYASLTARNLGCRVTVLTRIGDDLNPPLEGIQTVRQPAATTTTFENRYTEEGRTQRLLADAGPIEPTAAVIGRQIIHLGPVFQEVDAALLRRLASQATLLAITPQGCMREADDAGRIRHVAWRDAEAFLARCQVIVLSAEDVAGDMSLVRAYAQRVPTLVLTAGWRGATVFHGGQLRTFDAPPVSEVDPTGAGDIFTAAYLVHLHRSGDPWEAARFANCVAADSVLRTGLDSVPSIARIASCCEQLRSGRE